MGMMNAKEIVKSGWKPGKQLKPKVYCGDPLKDSLTKQEFAKESDINVIVGRYVKAGVPITPDAQAVFADVSSVGEFREHALRIEEFRDSFMSLPAVLRAQFDNDPAKLVDFLSDDNNYDEAVKLGLVQKKPEPLTTPDKPADPPGQPKSAESQK